MQAVIIPWYYDCEDGHARYKKFRKSKKTSLMAKAFANACHKHLPGFLGGHYGNAGDDSTAAALMLSGNHGNILDMALDPDTDPLVLEYLSFEESDFILYAVCANTSTPLRVIESILDRKSDLSRIGVAINPNITESMQLMLTGDDVNWVKATLALNSKVTARVLDVLSRDLHPFIRFRAAKSHNLDIETAKRLAQDENYDVRSSLSWNEVFAPQLGLTPVERNDFTGRKFFPQDPYSLIPANRRKEGWSSQFLYAIPFYWEKVDRRHSAKAKTELDRCHCELLKSERTRGIYY